MSAAAKKSTSPRKCAGTKPGYLLRGGAAPSAIFCTCAMVCVLAFGLPDESRISGVQAFQLTVGEDTTSVREDRGVPDSRLGAQACRQHPASDLESTPSTAWIVFSTKDCRVAKFRGGVPRRSLPEGEKPRRNTEARLSDDNRLSDSEDVVESEEEFPQGAFSVETEDEEKLKARVRDEVLDCFPDMSRSRECEWGVSLREASASDDSDASAAERDDAGLYRRC